MSQTKEVDLDHVRHWLYEKLKPSGWGDQLKTFLLSQDFHKILEQLLKESEAGQRFTPQIKQMLRAFELCPFDKLKVVMMGQDPYPYAGVCDGLAFSCSNTGKVQPSLRYIFQELEDTVYKGQPFDKSPDLARWAEQGVLLINSALTTTINNIGSHYLLWRPFHGFLFDILAANKPGMIYVMMGKEAQKWTKSIADNNYKFMVVHPAAAAHTRAEKWDSGDIFNKINTTLEKNGIERIIW